MDGMLSPRRHNDLACGVDVEPVQRRVLPGYRPPQARQAGVLGVERETFSERPDGGVDDEPRRAEGRLPEVEAEDAVQCHGDLTELTDLRVWNALDRLRVGHRHGRGTGCEIGHLLAMSRGSLSW